MPAETRRELILDAAMRAFAGGGYAGTSTDAVAKEAGVSQPYVVRMFGTKLDLFLAVFERACHRIDDTFARVIDERPFDPASQDDRERLGLSYSELVRDGDFLHVMMHGFSAGAVPEIGRTAREGMSRIVATLQRTGWNDEQVRDFFAYGMLLNVLLSMGAFELDSGPLADFVAACMPSKAALLQSASPQQPSPEA